MENSEKKEQKLALGEIWYAVKRNWIIEIAIFLVIMMAGVVYTRINNDYYVSSKTVVVKATFGEQTANTDMSLSKQNVATVATILRNGEVMKRAGYPSGSLNVSYSETSSSQTLDLTFTSSVQGGAKSGLEKIVKAAQEVVALEKDDGTSVYFSSNIKIDLQPIGEGYGEYAQSNDKRIILISFIGGLIAAFIVTILLYLINDKVSSVERVEFVSGVKNLSVIERVKTPESVDGYLKLDLKKLADTLIYMQSGDGLKVYQIQSTVSGEGKSTVAVNLAVSLGASQRKTLIIDCDFSRPSIHRMLKVSKKVGIVDYFKGEIDFDGMIKKTSAENVDLITCGDVVNNHTIFFASKKFGDIIREAKERYDFVFLDGAPIKALSDFIHLSKVVDGTVLLVGNDRIRTRDLNYSVRELESCDAHLVGTVFNFSHRDSRRRNYYYYYYRYRRTQPVVENPEQEEDNEKKEQ